MSQTTAQLISNLVQALAFESTSSAPDNGVYLSAANTLSLATNSIDRITAGTSELVINESGASVDFRVEGDTDANLLFIDASTDRIGIGTSSPFGALQVREGTDANVIFDTDGTETAIQAFNDAGNAQVPLRLRASEIKLFADGTQALTINSSQQVGIGATSPDSTLELASGPPSFKLTRNTTASTGNDFGRILFENSAGTTLGSIRGYSESANTDLGLKFSTGTGDTIALTIDEGQRVGIGNTSPSSPIDTGRLMVQNGDIVVRDDQSGNAWRRGRLVFDIRNSNGDSKAAHITGGRDSDISSNIQFHTTVSHSLSERMRIDDSGRLLVGTSTARDNFFNTSSFRPYIQLEGTSSESSRLTLVRNENNSGGPGLLLGKSRGSSAGSQTIAQSNDDLGLISFQGADGDSMVEAARIQADVNGTPGANDMPGQLSFFTNSGTTSVSERLRITSDGAWGLAGANYGSSGQVLTSQGSSSAPQWADAGGGLYESYAMLRQVLANNTNGGSTVSNTWTTYPINTESFDPDGIVSLSSNTFTLGAGTYRIDARTVFYRTYEVQTKLRNTSDSTDVFVGMSGYASGNDESNFEVTLLARFTISAQKNFQIQYNAAYGRASTGLGNPSNRAQQETYAVIEIFKEA